MQPGRPPKKRRRGRSRFRGAPSSVSDAGRIRRAPARRLDPENRNPATRLPENTKGATGKASGDALLSVLPQPGAVNRYQLGEQITIGSFDSEAEAATACPCQVAQNTRTRQGITSFLGNSRAQFRRVLAASDFRRCPRCPAVPPTRLTLESMSGAQAVIDHPEATGSSRGEQAVFRLLWTRPA